MTAAIFLYVFMGLIAGYFSARLYKTMKGREWKRSAFLTATLYPGIVFGTCFFLNFFIWDKHSSGAVPFTTMLSLLCLWFGISVPLVYLGYYFGYRKHPYQHPGNFRNWNSQALFFLSTCMTPIKTYDLSHSNVQFGRTWSRDKCQHNIGIWIYHCGKCSLLIQWTVNVISVVDFAFNFIYFQRADGWHPAIWSRIHWTVLCVYGDMAKSILLSLRIPFFGILHSGCELRSNINRDDILPIVWRGMHCITTSLFVPRLQSSSLWNI